MKNFWKELRRKGFISEEKYNRLMRKTPLTDEELASFINRQLVETRQSTKVVANLLKSLYKGSEIVYVKAKSVSDFRHKTLDVVKVRSLNVDPRDCGKNNPMYVFDSKLKEFKESFIQSNKRSGIIEEFNINNKGR